ncbi:MAG: phosphoenolpyruvate-utilizing N-terminal domain-containing protein [Lawsonibacter sp.]
METAVGKSIIGQIAFGRLRYFYRPIQEITEFSRLMWEEEQTRFQVAQKRAVEQLMRLYERATRHVGEGIASVFAVHAMLLEDEELVQAILWLLREKGVTAEYAVQTVAGRFGDTFTSMESTYMQARVRDIRDISYRMLKLLQGKAVQNPLREGPAILIADEFFPSEVVDLDHSRLLGLIARKGSVDSHTSLLLQAYGIPAMAQVDLSEEWDGHPALLDGYDHRLYLDPDRELLEQLRLRYQAGGMPRIINHPERKKELQTV